MMLSYRNQSIDLLCKSMGWFLYYMDLRYERVKMFFTYHTPKVYSYMLQSRIRIFLFFFFPSGFYFTNINDSQESRGKGRLSLYPLYHFHSPHRHFDISQVITAERSHLRTGSSQTRTGNLWFPNTIR